MKTRLHIRLLFTLSVLIPTAVFVANSTERYQNVWETAERQVEAVVGILQEHTLKVLETQELVLDLVEDLIRETPEPQLAAPATSERLTMLANRLRQTVSVWVANAEGTVIAGSIQWPAGLNIAGADYFQVQRDAPNPRFTSARYVGRSTGLPSFALSRRRPSEDGRFMGTIHVAISPLYFEEYFRLVRSEMPGASALFRADGAILARYPRRDAPDRLTPGSPVLTAIATQPVAGRVNGISSLDGVQRVYAYRRVGEFGVYVGHGVDIPAALAAWRISTIMRGIGALAFILLLCGSTWLIARSLADRQEALTRLQEESELREAMQRQLQDARALEALGRMARGVAHDFNNLLTVVIGNLEALGQQPQEPAARRAVEGARRAADAGAQLAANLLTYARTQVLQRESFQVASFLRGQADLLQEIATPARRLALDIAPDLPDCRADLVQLQAALGNLVANARDATKPGGLLVLAAHRATLGAVELAGNPTALPGEFVAISVTDDGRGMTQETAARAFEPFYTTKPDGEGSGLGLSQVFGLLRQLQGHVAISSVPGEGTCVTLYLPCAQDPSRREPVPEPESERGSEPRKAAAAPQTARILVVDDQPEVRSVAVSILERAGYSVLAAASGEEALQRLDVDAAIHLVLSDVVMPGGMDGVALVRRLHESHPGLPALLMSGYAPGLETLDGLEIGVVRKPFTRRVLLEAVEGALVAARCGSG